MIILAIVTPGTWIASDDPEFRGPVRRMLDVGHECIFRANHALNLHVGPVNMQRPYEIVQDDDAEIRYWAAHDAKSAHSSANAMLATRRTYEGGKSAISDEVGRSYPRSLISQHNLLTAEAFVFALNSYRMVAHKLSKYTDAPKSKIEAVIASFDSHFPGVKHIRDSIAHFDERLTRKAFVKGKLVQINPKSAEEAGINGSAMIQGFFNGRYFLTAGDGTQPSIAIEATGLLRLRTINDQLLNCFDWHGPPEYLPHSYY